ncbi:Uncharacterised protein [Mycobacterium tuberculosis]|uniref:Uncharacterized protein n=1 Tax=Mycobacterium tuberculosis TaxID=1773 RepID=A0A655AF10_MYCTX|nr:Uncharacterised protein [Mycobacterium tuberculosis]CKQ02203.1 Uncharacterised protein [Mycobacterium tuberculosis]CKS34300.1 Uncharacterised protein [Mycobacterium tuberculosis]CKS59119.1 Uncharacterised protein [Mycobacterium tuberculosis]CNU30095.1 Uncharacterised protein [Mycobacterium tuberculosis]
MGCRRHRGGGRDAGSAGIDADPAGRGFQVDRRDPAGSHRHRRGVDRHRDAAPARRRRQIRRVLRRGRGRGAAGQPRHPGQHESRIRFHRSDFPDRRRNHQVSAVYRSHAGAGRTGRGLRQGAGHVARSQARAGVLGIPRTQPIRRGAVDRRTKASTGPNRVGASQINIPRADLPLCRQWFPGFPPRPALEAGRGSRGDIPGQRPGAADVRQRRRRH